MADEEPAKPWYLRNYAIARDPEWSPRARAVEVERLKRAREATAEAARLEELARGGALADGGERLREMLQRVRATDAALQAERALYKPFHVRRAYLPRHRESEPDYENGARIPAAVVADIIPEIALLNPALHPERTVSALLAKHAARDLAHIRRAHALAAFAREGGGRSTNTGAAAGAGAT